MSKASNSAIVRVGTWVIAAAAIAAFALYAVKVFYMIAIEPEKVAQEASEAAEKRAVERERIARAEAEQRRVAAEEQAREEARRAEAARLAEELRIKAERELDIQLAMNALIEMQPLLQQWDDARALASASPRVSLAPQISSMQRIRREFMSSPPVGSQCVRAAHRRIVAAMGLGIDAYIKFLARDEQSAKNLIGRYDNEMDSIKDGIKKCVQ